MNNKNTLEFWMEDINETLEEAKKKKKKPYDSYISGMFDPELEAKMFNRLHNTDGYVNGTIKPGQLDAAGHAVSNAGEGTGDATGGEGSCCEGTLNDQKETLVESSIIFNTATSKDGELIAEYRWDKGNTYKAGVYRRGANDLYRTEEEKIYSSKEKAKAAYLNYCKKYNLSPDTVETEALTEAKRYVRRYYIRPQEIFCSNKTDIIKALIDIGDDNCSVYTLNNLGDVKDVTKLTNDDIIYYYDNGILYDKNRVKVMDYDLYVKHEEERDKINPDQVSDATFKDHYEDRITDITDPDAVNESLTEATSNDYLTSADFETILNVAQQKVKSKSKNVYEIRTINTIINDIMSGKQPEQIKTMFYMDNLSTVSNFSKGYVTGMFFSDDLHTIVVNYLFNGKSEALAVQDLFSQIKKGSIKTLLSCIKEAMKEVNAANTPSVKERRNIAASAKLTDAIAQELQQHIDSIVFKVPDLDDVDDVYDFEDSATWAEKAIENLQKIYNDFYNLPWALEAEKAGMVKDRKISWTDAKGRSCGESCAYNIAKCWGLMATIHFDTRISNLSKETKDWLAACKLKTGDALVDGIETECVRAAIALINYFKDVKFYENTDSSSNEEINEFDQDFDSINAYGEKVESLTEAKKETHICCICGEEFEGYGNNPSPIKEKGVCCDSCNMHFVIPARIEAEHEEKNEELEK